MQCGAKDAQERNIGMSASTNALAQERAVPLSVPRQATPDDLPAICQMLDSVFSTERRSVSLAKSYPHIYSPDNAANILIVTSGDQVVSALSLWPNEVQVGPARLRVAGLNCVATLPEYRRHGLATHLMRAAVTRMLALRCHLGLVSAMIPNFHRRGGWELAGRMRTYQINRGNVSMLPKLPDKMYVEGATETTIDEAYGIYCQHATGALRSHETFRRLLRSRHVSELLVARTVEQGVAYLLAAGQRVIEWGGAPLIVASLVRTWFSRLDEIARKKGEEGPSTIDSVSLVSPPQHGLVDLFNQLGIPCSVNYLRMMLPLDPQGILRAYALDNISVRETSGAFTLTSKTQEVTLDRTAVTKLLFGPERITDFAGDLFPLPFWQWPLDCV
jgi:predicted N-acetyltransferase YhbS